MTNRPIFAVFAGLALICLVPCVARAATDYYEGEAFSPDDGRLLYHERHWAQRQAGSMRRITLFACPDGRPFARRILREGAGAAAPDFDFEDARDGYREGLRSEGGKRVAYTQAPGARERSAVVQVPQGGVADAGFDARMRELWPQLAAGRAANVAFLIPSRLAFYDFHVEPERPQPNPTQLRVRLRMDAWYAFVAPDIRLVYDTADRRLAEFSGLSTIRDDRGRYRKVRISFPDRPASAPMSADAAATAPLGRRCGR
ncbi:hypothetical protein [Lysobacter enzymogenes]|uniref:hypothetical protein n=1 Tax=Lysobacter enzymogenes TaxID=69 RepID=UPI001AFA9FFA|nr:hypothetical protein [Lysobacter enzymogenes]QQQ00852.1 hypothetical protein JHW41_22760 [Lysobacter enzymogenes]